MVAASMAGLLGKQGRIMPDGNTGLPLPLVLLLLHCGGQVAAW